MNIANYLRSLLVAKCEKLSFYFFFCVFNASMYSKYVYMLLYAGIIIFFWKINNNFCTKNFGFY